MKNKQKILYTIGGILGAVIIYYIYEYFRLAAIYSKQVTLSQAEIDIQNPQEPLIQLPDSDLQDAINAASNAEEGQYSGNDDLDDTATINGIKYTLEDNGTYTSLDGKNIVFNPINSTLTTNDGLVETIDQNNVVYTNTNNP